jgi:formylglycine-generating enzyme required for sulfatase activity
MVERFFATASEPAKKLAKMMAAAPVSMQVVNLIRKTLLNEVRPVHVAEFYMGGLLKPIVENEEGQYRVYDFLPGVRQVLNDAIGRRQTIKVLDAISQYIAGEIKSPIRSFAALLTLLPTYPPEQREKILPFAQVSIEVLRNLGGEYAEFAEEIAVNISNPLPIPQSSPPPLKTSIFDVATIEILETRTFEFIVATIERQSQRIGFEPKKWVIKKEKRQAEGIVQKLAEGVELELMEIPGGTFTMGTENEEIERLVKKFGWDGFRRERPQHRVTVSSFYMGRYPITQAQWQAIAATAKIDINLETNPSHFKGDELPVESVNWYEATEFCKRLSRETKREYRLPSEAEWEYACRAGTTTAFHFGETITTDLANYSGTDWERDKKVYPGNYGRGLKGIDRKQTTPVGYFKVANAFGLYDMHGNVWEWCQDDYHPNYQGAPTDGSAWISKNKFTTKVLRGGSWGYDPYLCRSAIRDSNNRRGLRGYYDGFRVVCVFGRTV